MNLSSLLKRRAASGNPVRVGLIGAGKFGTMFLCQARLTEGIQIVGVADLEIGRIVDGMTRSGWPNGIMSEARSTGDINDAAARGEVALTVDAFALIHSDLDVIVECTGIPELGAEHALAAFEASRHVVMVTVEADALVGPLLHEIASEAGLVYSMAFGDQPALVCELVDWAYTCGFEVVAAGKGTKYLPEYHYSTPDTVFAHYGFSEEQVAQGDFNAKMFNSFLDGTKSAIEMSAIANATGLVPQPEGLQFPPAGVDELAKILKPIEDGGVLSRDGTVEVVSSLHRDGSPVERDLRWGVYVTFKAATDYARRCFLEYGIPTDSSGVYSALYRPCHLIGMELGISVASVALRNQPTGTSCQFLADVCTVAKADLDAGTVLDGEGGYTVYGKVIPAETSLVGKMFPLGLASGVKLANPVVKDQVVRYEDVILDPNESLVKLRRQLETRSEAGQ
jgi:predicted homoserine dehydrogenase-like protein